MNPQAPPEFALTPEIDSALAQLAPLFADSARLPHSADLLRRAQLRDREVAAERLARWHGRVRLAALGLLGLAAAAVVYGIDAGWTSWLLVPFVEGPAAPADAAVLAGTVLTASAAVVWIAQQFAEE